jgi:predicted nucleic acid-binding protein
MSLPEVVIDTNVVLDWLVFGDPRVQPLAAALEGGRLCWWRSAGMAGELERVLDYPALQPWLAAGRLDKSTLLAHAARHVTPAAEGAPAPLHLRCSDPDDQCFIDLALAHPGCRLISRDKALLALRKQASARGVEVLTPAQWAVA